MTTNIIFPGKELYQSIINLESTYPVIAELRDLISKPKIYLQ